MSSSSLNQSSNSSDIVSSDEYIDLTNINRDNILYLIKQHARICHDSDDILLNKYIDAAIRYLRRQYGIIADNGVYSAHYDYPSNTYPISIRPLKAVNSIFITTHDNIQIPLTPSEFTILNDKLVINYKFCYTSVDVEYQAGDEYYSPEIVESLLLLVSYYYDNRSANVESQLYTIPDGIMALMPYYQGSNL